MSVYTDRKNFFRMLSVLNKQVRHNHADENNEGIKRKSFIQIDNPEELTAAVLNQAHIPMVVHADFEGKPVDKNGSIRIRNINELLFLDKPQTLATDVTVTAANDRAYNRSFSVMMEFISWMYETYEETGQCGPFKDIDVSLFSWRKQDYILDGYVGWILNFPDEVSAKEITEFDDSKWYGTLSTEELENLLTEDGETILS